MRNVFSNGYISNGPSLIFSNDPSISSENQGLSNRNGLVLVI
jgi:hypothetical protein